MEEFRQDAAGYFGETNIHPLGLVVVLALALATLFVPRRWAWVPIVVVACFVSPAQRIMIAGNNFDFTRLLIAVGWVRLLARNELRRLDWNAVDTCVALFVGVGLIFYKDLYGDTDALKYRLGWAYDEAGLYFLFRYCFQGDADPRRFISVFAVLSVPVAVFFAIESMTQHNLFSVFGGVPPLTWIRDSRLRCQGAFAHPVIAGVFWGSLLPMLAALLRFEWRWRRFAIIGIPCCLVIVLATNSSTSVSATAAAVFAICCFPLRAWMRPIRWCLLGLVFALHMVMKAPVWHLIARVSAYDASTGYHRFLVIDQAIRHLDQWWLAGVSVPVLLGTWDAVDITNEYVLVGVEAGLAALACFVALIGYTFRQVGRQCRQYQDNRPALWMSWALGCSLFVHATNFIALAYFAQAKMEFLLLLALIASQSQLAAGRRIVVARRTEGTDPRPAMRAQ